MKKHLLSSMLTAVMLTLGMGAWAQAAGDVVTVNGADYDVLGANIVTNGSFDNGVDGWYAGNWADANATNYVLHTEGGFDGGAYLEYSAGGATAETNIRNKWQVEKGKTYLFRCYTSGKTPDSNNLQYSFIALSDDGTNEGTKIYQLKWGAASGQEATGWNQNDFVFTAENDGWLLFRSSWTSSSKLDGFFLGQVAVSLAGAKTLLEDEIKKAETLLANPDYTTDADAFKAAIAQAKDALETATTVEQLNAAVEALKAAEQAFIEANTFKYQKYLIMNIASEMYWGAANDWGTKASLVPYAEYVKLVPQTDGTYYMESQVNNGGTSYYFNGEYMDNGSPVKLTIKKAEMLGYADEAETIPVYAYTIANGTNYYGWDGKSTVLGQNLAADSENALWVIASLDDAKAAISAATALDPMDATMFIEDHNFGRNNRYSSNWQGTGLTKAGDNTNMNTQSYMAAFDVYQELTVPNGVYKLEAQAAVTYHDNRTVKAYDGEGAPVIYANEASSDFNEMLEGDQLSSQAKMSTQFSAGMYEVEPVYVEVTDGKLKIGAKCEREDIWAVWDNFRLTYFGSETSVSEAKNSAKILRLYELIGMVQELAKNEAIVYTRPQLEAVVALIPTYESMDPADLSEELLNTGIEALEQIVDHAQAELLAANVLPQMKAFTETTNFYTKEALDAYYTQWNEKYTAGQLTRAEAAVLQDPFVVTSWRAANTVDDLLMSVWDAATEDWATYHVNTWSIEGSNDGSNFVVPFIEYWTGDGESLAEKTLTATIEGLEKGVYDVNAWVRVRMKDGATGAAAGIALQANDGAQVDVTTGDQVGTSPFYLKEYTAQGEVAEDGKLTVKFIVNADNNISWLSFKDMNYELNAEATAISEVSTSRTCAAAIYNVAGQRVVSAQKGLYIQNGKKFIVK